MTEAEKTALEAELAQMTEVKVVRRYNQCDGECEEADIIASVMQRRNIDN